MTESITNSTAPAVVTTTVQQPQHPIPSGVTSLDNTTVFLGFVVAAVMLLGGILGIWQIIRNALRENKREEQAGAMARMAEIKEWNREVVNSTNAAIEGIKADQRHRQANNDQKFDALTHYQEKCDRRAEDMRKEITVLQVNAQHTETEVDQLKTLIKEKFDETKALIKDSNEARNEQFAELAKSIREIRDAKPKGMA